ncbi:hypothetical protein FBU30_000784 [Linnemannia zychae]|nr:hypothetical protein FBU30_000784 [Linnemannia zychae]
MEILKGEFEAKLSLLEKAISECDFVSMDTEMTGLSMPANVYRVPDSLSTRYSKVSHSASEFLVAQLGICTFTWSNKLGAYEARPFNFPCFPSSDNEAKVGERFFSVQSSSLEFLLKNHFDFNKWVCHGIPYMTRREEQDYIIRKTEKEKIQATITYDNIPIDDRSRPFVESTIAKIQEWLDKPDDVREEWLKFDNVNAFFRRLIYQIIRTDFNGGLDSTSNNFARTMALRRMTDDIRREKEEGKSAKPPTLNLRRVLDMISEAKKPLIGHNCFLDLMQITQQFLWDLPVELDDWKSALMAEWKTVIDTKHLATHPLIVQHLSNSALDVVNVTVQEDPFRTVGPKVVMAEGYDRYVIEPVKDDTQNAQTESPTVDTAVNPAVESNTTPNSSSTPSSEDSNDNYHEAGFDAFITGRAYLRFAGYILKEHQRLDDEEQEHAQKKQRIDGSDDANGNIGSEQEANGQNNGTMNSSMDPKDEAEDGELEETPMEKEAIMERRKRIIMDNPTNELLEDDELQSYYNKLYIMRSDFPVMNLAGPEPEPEERPFTYMLRKVHPSIQSSTLFHLFKQYNPFAFTWSDDSSVWLQISKFAPGGPGEESTREPYEPVPLPLGRLGEEYVNPFCIGDDEITRTGRMAGVIPEAADIEVISWKQWYDEREAKERQQREMAKQQKEMQASQYQQNRRGPLKKAFRAGMMTPQASTPVTDSPRVFGGASSSDKPNDVSDATAGAKRKYDGEGEQGR